MTAGTLLLEKPGLVPGFVLSRYKRFLADVRLEGGEVVVAHCTNTGRMTSCWMPEDLVLLEPRPGPGRKLPFTWLACRRGEDWVGVDTGLPNRVVAQAARLDLLPGLPGLRGVQTERRYGQERSRVDVLALDAEGRSVYIEVKNTTLRSGTTACFPDAVTERGTRHLRELRGMVEAGHRAAIVFFVNRGDVDSFDAAREVDPAYALELERASAAGVAVLPLRVDLRAEAGPSGAWTLSFRLEGLLPWRPRV